MSKSQLVTSELKESSMKSVSTGVGLCVLGACVLGAAAVSSPRLGNIATAASGNTPAPPITKASMPPRMMMQRDVPMGMAGISSSFGASLTPISSKASDDSCQELEPDIWFTTLHPIDVCFTDGTIHIGLADYTSDINGDGRLESVFTAAADLNSNSTGGALLKQVEVVFDGTMTSFRHQTVMTAARMVTFIQSQPNLPNDWRGAVQLYGFRDMDKDGDLDAIIAAGWWNDDDPNYRGERIVWAENTGYQTPPSLNPYDLDHDGHVNTGDLSLMLMEFTD